MQQPRAYIFTNFKIKNIKNNTFLKVLVMSLSPSLFLLFLRMNSTYMPPGFLRLWRRVQTPQHQIQTPQHQNTSSHTSRGEPLIALRHSTTWFSSQVHQATLTLLTKNHQDWKPHSEQLPEVIEPQGLPQERQKYLHDKIRDACKDIVCPPPHTQTPHNHDSTLLPSTSPSPSPPSSPPPKRSRKSRAN